MTRFLLFLLIVFANGAVPAADTDNLLEPEKAFSMSTRAIDAHTLEVSFAIAEGYYMYRERFKFALEPGSKVRLGAPQFPPGTRKKDEFFGEVETYRKQVMIRVPVIDSGNEDTLRLTVTSQGCADAGVCYVPMDSKATIPLTALSLSDANPLTLTTSQQSAGEAMITALLPEETILTAP